MLTTVDNPFDPFEDFGSWYQYDVSSGYHTSSFLARIVKTSEQLSDADQDRATELAIEEIIKENVNGVYRKVSKEFPD